MALDLTWVRMLLSLTGTVVYFLVGITVGRRSTSREAVAAMRAFQIWWFGLAVLTVFTPLMKLMDYLPDADSLFTARLFLLQSVLVLIMVAIGGLLYYLLFVYTGKSWIIWPVVIYAFLETVWLMTIISQAHPIAYGPECPSAGFCYENAVTGSTASTLLSLSFSLPILIATGMYFTLFFRVETTVQKRRVAMVAGALGIWFLGSLVASLVKGSFETSQGAVEYVPLSQWVYWSFVVSPLISLAASIVIYWAYKMGPPKTPAPRPAVPAAEQS